MKIVLCKDGHTYIYDTLGLHGPECQCVATVLHPNNAEFIQVKGSEGRLHVCSSNNIDPDRVDDATYIAESVKQMPAAGAGGWRMLMAPEYNALQCYRAAADFDLDSTKGMAIIKETFGRHPTVLGGFSFTLMEISKSLISTIRGIYDVRRFGVGASGIKRLLTYLRFHRSKNVVALLDRYDSGVDPSPGMRRVHTAYQAMLTAMVPPQTKDPTLQSPFTFLAREVVALTQQYEKQTTPLMAQRLAGWRVAQRFAKFLYLTWLDGLEEIDFDPFRFFKRQDEAEKFVDYYNASS